MSAELHVNVDAAVEFLRKITPTGCYGNVTAIDAYSAECTGAGFRDDSLERARAFISANTSRNLYWTVNGPGDCVDKKPAKPDIAAMRWAHLDHDDPSPEALERIRTASPPPTLIIFSGGGYGAFWRLAEPVQVNGNLDELEAINKRLIEVFEAGKGTWNIDRLMRLPWTVNHLSEKKRRDGRQPAATYLVEHHPERLYTLEQLRGITCEDTRESAAAGDESLHDSPDHPGSDRSRDLLAKVGIDVRAGLGDDEIMARHLGHPHAQDQADPRRAVQRCINRCRSGSNRASGTAPPPVETDESHLAALAELDDIAYDRAREAAAEKLGIRVATLDAERTRRRAARGQQRQQQQERQQRAEAGAAPLADGLAEGVRELLADLRPDEVVLPNDYVPFPYAASRLFQRMAKKREAFCRKGVVLELKGNALDIMTAAKLRSRIDAHGRRVLAVKATKNDGLILAPKRCSADTADALLATRETDCLPPIELVVNAPVLIEEAGELRTLGPGYHEGGGGVLVLGGKMPEVVALEQATDALLALLTDFRFTTAADRSRAVAGIIGPAIRAGGSLPGHALIDCAEADASQTGKGYLMRLKQATYGEVPRPFGRREGGVGSFDEDLGAQLLRASSFVLIDNVRGRLASEYLESILTADDEVAVRLPYKGAIPVSIRRMVFQLTSNGIETTADLANRMLITRLLKQQAGHTFAKFPEGGLLEHVRARQPYL